MKTLSTALLASLVLGSACDRGASRPSPTPPSAAPIGEVVNAPPPEDDPNQPIAARFWVEVEPTKGTARAYELHPGNVIYRGQELSVLQNALRYDYSGTAQRFNCTPGGTCVPPPGTIRAFTPQENNTFIGLDGNCHSNNGPCDGSPGHAPFPTSWPCLEPNTWCGDVQLVSKYGHPLNNLVMRVANVGTGSSACGTPPDAPVMGCQPRSTTSDLGLCDFQIGPGGAGGEKVGHAESNLVSCIPGSYTDELYPCDYCFGNGGRIDAAGDHLAGLKAAVMPNLDDVTAEPMMKGLNTVRLAAKLTSDATIPLTIEFRFTRPGLHSGIDRVLLGAQRGNGDCAVAGVSNIILHGGGFGPPSACYGPQPLASCPEDESTSFSQ